MFVVTESDLSLQFIVSSLQEVNKSWLNEPITYNINCIAEIMAIELGSRRSDAVTTDRHMFSLDSAIKLREWNKSLQGPF